MPRPALVKLGGSLLTDKAAENSFKRAAARRLVGELAKAEVPCVLLHGAGSFGHPQARRHRIGQARPKPEGIADVLSAVAMLHAEMLGLANASGLRPLSIPLDGAHGEGDELADLPVAAVRRALDEGYTPVLHGSLVRDRSTGWRVLSADELLARLAGELAPRLAVFATDVDGVYDRDPSAAGAKLLPRIKPGQAIASSEGDGEDVTGRMEGKLAHAFACARACPTLIVNGGVRNRLLDALKGKNVPSTRIDA